MDMVCSLSNWFFWILVHAITLSFTIFLIAHLWKDYMGHATIVSLESRDYHVANVKFPGVAICPVNKISKEAATKFADYLSRVTHENRTILMRYMKLFGSLYDFEEQNAKYAVKFHEILQKYDKSSETEFYDPSLRLKMLSTQCSDLLIDCSWNGIEQDCTKLFRTRRSHEGFCCIFNYVRPQVRYDFYNETSPLNNVSETSSFSTAKYGLRATIRDHPDDYFYTTLSTTGVKVLIFYPKDYPDIISGGVRELIVNPGLNAFITIKPETFESTEPVESYSPEHRHCIFEHERTTIFGRYRHSDCLVQCRLSSIFALCDCIPFMLPVDVKIKEFEDATVCSFPDVACLSHFKNKWMRYYFDNGFRELKQEQENSLRCSQCLPTCQGTVYEVISNYVPLMFPNSSNPNIIRSNISLFYFGSYSMLYKQDVTLTWFEILSSFGGVFSVIMGASLLNMVELVAHFTYKFIIFHKK